MDFVEQLIWRIFPQGLAGVKAVPILFHFVNCRLAIQGCNVQEATSGDHDSLYRGTARSEYCFAGSLRKLARPTHRHCK